MMRRRPISRSISILLALAVILVFSVAATTGAYAASKKTVYLPTSTTTTYKYDADSIEKSTYKYKYDKNGLLKKELIKSEYMSGDKVVYKRTKAGAIKSVSTYAGKSLIYLTKNTIKKGNVVKSKEYNVVKGKKKLAAISTYTYYKNGNMKKSVYDSKEDGSKYTTYYRKNGTRKKSISKSDYSTYKTTYDKNGLEKEEEFTYGEGEYKSYGTTTYTYKLNKKGDVVKSVAKEKTQESDRQVTYVTTRTTKYKYDKHGNILKEKTTSVRQDGSNKSVSSYITTSKYKKMKVNKKYLKYVGFGY